MSKRWTLQLISVLNWRPSVYSLSLSSLFANLPWHLLALLTGLAFCVIRHNTDCSDCLILEFYRQCQWKLVIGIRQFRALVFHNCDWWTLGRVNCTVVHSFLKTTIAVRNNIPSLSLSPPLICKTFRTCSGRTSDYCRHFRNFLKGLIHSKTYFSTFENYFEELQTFGNYHIVVCNPFLSLHIDSCSMKSIDEECN